MYNIHGLNDFWSFSWTTTTSICSGEAFGWFLLHLSLCIRVVLITVSLVLLACVKPYLGNSATIASHAVAMRHKRVISWRDLPTSTRMQRDEPHRAMLLVHNSVLINHERCWAEFWLVLDHVLWILIIFFYTKLTLSVSLHRGWRTSSSINY